MSSTRFLIASSALREVTAFCFLSSFSRIFFSSSSLCLTSLILTSSSFSYWSRFLRTSSRLISNSFSLRVSVSFFCLASFQTWPGARLLRGGSFLRPFSEAYSSSSSTSATSWISGRSLRGALATSSFRVMLSSGLTSYCSLSFSRALSEAYGLRVFSAGLALFSTLFI